MVTATKRLLMAGIVLALSGLAGPATLAQDRQLCARLASQLDDHIGDRPPTRHYQRYAMAVEHQQQLIERTHRDLERMGCSEGSVILYGRGYTDCRHLAADLRRMRADLVSMQRRRDAHSGQDGSAARQRVMEALAANGCDVPGGVRIRRHLGVAGTNDGYGFGDPAVRYRTMCVRICDGYYFPVSYSVPPMAFDRDSAQCSAMCPGTEARLYVHRVPDEDSPDMISIVDRTPYAALPSAFAYRDQAVGRKPQCSCEISTPAQSVLRPTTEPSIVTLPAGGAKTVPGPEVEPTSAAATPEPALRDIDPSRRVRVIGPTFLPDRSDAIDLTAPLPSGGL